MKAADNTSAYSPWIQRCLRMRLFQIAALVFVLAGIVFLYLFSVKDDLPQVQVAEISPQLNVVTVRLSGEVVRDAYSDDSGCMVFVLNDGTGEIKVIGGRAQADALAAAKRFPRRGDRVEVTGCLSVHTDQGSFLRLQSSDSLVLHRKRVTPSSRVASEMALAELTPAQRGRFVGIVGTLKTVEVPLPGASTPYRLILEEEGAERTVIFWEEVFQGLEGRLPRPGKRIRAQGRIEIFQEEVQLRVMNAGDLSVVTGSEKMEQRSASLPVRIAEIQATQQGQIFTVVGTLGEPRSIRGGVMYPLTDDSGEIAVLFWDKQVSGEERAAVESGVRIRVTAPLVVYKGTLELVPENVGGFTVDPAP